MSKLSKDEWDRLVMPRELKLRTHGTAFDTRILDRMEGACSEFRYWSHPKQDDRLPPGYRERQLEAARALLRKTAQEILDAFARLDRPILSPPVIMSKDGDLACPNEDCLLVIVPIETAVHRSADATFWCPSCGTQLVTP